MDFLHLNANNRPARTDNATNPNHGGPSRMSSMVGGQPRWLRIIFVVLLFSATIVAIAIALLMSVGNRPNEGNLVDTNKYQAVFLTNGQVYFGKVKEVNSKYLNVQEIYYLNTGDGEAADTQKQATESATFSLVKLGCELHGPTDQMIVNREQVTFWENLKTDGKVAAAIADWKSQNPKGQDCNQSNAQDSTQQSTTGTGTPAANKETTTGQ